MTETLDNRPSLALRLGITGARNLRGDQLERIGSQLEDVFALVKTEMERLSSLPEVARAYASQPGSQLTPRLRLISPIALGADRMAATEALAQGYEIFVPMPFPQQVYEEDFTGNLDNPADAKPISAEEDLAEFRQLLSRAAGHLELDGARGDGPDEGHTAGKAYEAVGRFVARHCDLVIAIWDGKPSNGRGGTAEIVHFAAATGIPVWWIHAEDADGPEWLADVHDIQDRTPDAPEAQSAAERLNTFLGRLIVPPVPSHRHKGTWDKVAAWFAEKEDSPLAAYFAEKPLLSRRVWKTYARVMRWSGGKHELTATAPAPSALTVAAAEPAANPVAAYWFDCYTNADGRASEYAERYRSGYLLTILSTMTVLASGAIALGLGVGPAHKEFLSGLMGSIELGTLLLIVVLILLAVHYEWHRKSIEYRLLAELFRKEETLAAVGWALSIEKVQELADSEQLSWIGWLFAATQRSGPLPEGSIAPIEAGRARLLSLIDEQLAYHRRREKQALHASGKLEELGTITFAAVLLFVLVKLAAELRGHSNIMIGCGVIATALAGVSAAFVAIRGYAELPLLAEQSHHMILELVNARARVSRLDANRPLVSQDLGTQAAGVATLMLQDLDGWGRLFRGKLLEAS